MTLLDTLLPIVTAARAIPGQMGLRPHRVFIRSASWSGANTGDGRESPQETEIVEACDQPPKVRWLSGEELVVGDLAAGTVEVGPITPEFSGGGTAADLIRGVGLSTGDTLHVRIVGPTHPEPGALYAITKTNFDHALHYSFQATPVANA